MHQHFKEDQLGYVDKAFMTEGEEGFRLAKVEFVKREFRRGDKFCSRCGQKDAWINYPRRKYAIYAGWCTSQI